jgi:hypothetical protein
MNNSRISKGKFVISVAKPPRQTTRLALPKRRRKGEKLPDYEFS